MSGQIIKIDSSLISNDYNISAFERFLNGNQTVCELDLSRCNLIQVINTMTEVKSMMSPNYGKRFSSLLHHIREIESRFKCCLMPYHINDIFWCNFVPYLINKGMALSSVKTLCSQLKSSLHWGALHHARISSTYDCITLPKYQHQQIALTPDEVSHIYHYDLRLMGNRRKQYIEHMDRVRDMFVLSCNLGQRFSDMIRINPSCFSRNIFRIVQQKTGNTAYCDIDRMSLDANTTYRILDKYHYHAPLQTDISCYNRYLQEFLKNIGFDQVIMREMKVNGYIRRYEKAKWQLITSHTGRRTFATVNIIRGRNTHEVRRATGHSSESAFEKYICYYE